MVACLLFAIDICPFWPKNMRERERGVSESFFLSALMTYTCSILVFEIEKSEHQNLKKNMEIVYTNEHVRFISKIVTD